MVSKAGRGAAVTLTFFVSTFPAAFAAETSPDPAGLAPTPASDAARGPTGASDVAAAAAPSGGRGLHAVPEVGDEAKVRGCDPCDAPGGGKAAVERATPDARSRAAPPAARGPSSNRGYVVGAGGVARLSPGGEAQETSDASDPGGMKRRAEPAADGAARSDRTRP